MKDFLNGIFIIFTVILLCYYINTLIQPYHHATFLEWVGIVMIGVLIKSGFDEYQRDE